jgi:hypothetical protein
MVNAFAGPDNWNTLDMIYSASTSQYSEVRLNGVVVQRNIAVAPLRSNHNPILIGDGNATFRNTWVKSLGK